MNKSYLFLFLLFVFGFNQMSAVPCPNTATVNGGGTKLTITYDTAIDCVNMPGSITTSENGGATWTLSSCLTSQNTAFYNYDSGTAPDVGGTLTIDSGFDASCSYDNSVLPISDYELLKASVSVYPNPLTKNNILNLKFGFNTSAKISIYTVTGKLALKDEINNTDSKQMDVSALTNGIYFLKISTDNASITRKVVIMK